MSLTRLSLAIACAIAAAPLRADPAPAPAASPETYDQLERIIVSATFAAQAVKDVAAETTVLLREDMDRRLNQDLRDLVRYEPGVSVTGGGRFGLSGFAIRGLDGNRVRIEVDGVSASDAFAIGSFSSAGRDFVDLDSLKRVEIVRGAASALHGSDALGGVVSFVTKDPVDYVADGADGSYVGIKGLYDSADRQSTESVTGAVQNGRHGFVAVLTHRDGRQLNNRGERDSFGSTRTRPNPQDTDSNALLAKYVYGDAKNFSRVTLDASRSDSTTNALDQLGVRSVGGAPMLYTRLDADDRKERARLSFDQLHTFGGGFADTLDWRIYTQTSDTRQDTFEDRANLATGTPTNPISRYRRFEYEQREHGVEALAHKRFETGAATHDLAYGAEYEVGRIREQRDGFQRNLTTGTVTNVVSPDVFPVRDFPLTDTSRTALFVQDDIGLADGRLHLVPALRYDRFEIDPRRDPVFEEDNPGVEPVQLDSDRVSPKFAAIYTFSENWRVYGQLTTGFRAPPYSDVNVGFTNLQFGYTALPNPDLKPETSRGGEVGLRVDGDAGYASVAAYRNRYKDFIESLVNIGTDPETGLMLFQSRNIGRVDIRGAEASAGLRLGRFSDALEGFEVRTSLATARGDDRVRDVPLTSIEPAKAVLGLSYEAAQWGAEVVATFVREKTRLAPAASGTAFAAPGYGVVDAYVHYEPLPSLTLYAGLTNIGDKRYWEWNSVRGMSVTAAIDRYSAPGRAASAGFKLAFD
ncbi:MAG TPA: TonB-dependent hemoglobin/transferrin/lactoferrin family receptor [Tahibacter sp.]|uniref:TonB-dependent hemoglobin/transferrin/lactoferrin family receptor n=1 Tax=Tahibacter sp. TaxID=2056211 RepID=UPI002CF465B4|nr:TonB-dependent hemoglobin/transferrin/lactoferrin family receptor [Tahibacter sp.]HSX60288.1 TonB-dependent hemoglobin/transferrin/lactoferrin family receptor [Tahibacter sp.]